MTPLKASAAPSAYLVFCAIWMIGGLYGAYSAFRSPDVYAWTASFFCFGVAGLTAARFRGFRIVVEDGRLRYRDGLYRWRECRRADFESFQIDWGGRKKAPRLVINTRSGDRIPIDIKPFEQDDLRRLFEIINPSPVPPWRLKVKKQTDR